MLNKRKNWKGILQSCFCYMSEAVDNHNVLSKSSLTDAKYSSNISALTGQMIIIILVIEDLIFYVFVCVCLCAYMPSQDRSAEVRGKLDGFVTPFLHMNLQDLAQVVRLSIKGLYLLSDSVFLCSIFSSRILHVVIDSFMKATEKTESNSYICPQEKHS